MLLSPTYDEQGEGEIVDRSGLQLRDLSAHFEAGTETAYCSAYLYAIFGSASRQLTVISASTGPWKGHL